MDAVLRARIYRRLSNYQPLLWKDKNSIYGQVNQTSFSKNLRKTHHNYYVTSLG